MGDDVAFPHPLVGTLHLNDLSLNCIVTKTNFLRCARNLVETVFRTGGMHIEGIWQRCDMVWVQCATPSNLQWEENELNELADIEFLPVYATAKAMTTSYCG
jgi:hypothetical protein